MKLFVSAFKATSSIPYVQDAEFDPSDGNAPYRPHRYNSPACAGGSGSHGTCGVFSVTVIGCSLGTEVSAIRDEINIQDLAAFAREVIAAAKPDADQTTVDAVIDKFINDDFHNFDAMKIDPYFDGYANGRELFLRF